MASGIDPAPSRSRSPAPSRSLPEQLPSVRRSRGTDTRNARSRVNPPAANAVQESGPLRECAVFMLLRGERADGTSSFSFAIFSPVLIPVVLFHGPVWRRSGDSCGMRSDFKEREINSAILRGEGSTRGALLFYLFHLFYLRDCCRTRSRKARLYLTKWGERRVFSAGHRASSSRDSRCQ